MNEMIVKTAAPEKYLPPLVERFIDFAGVAEKSAATYKTSLRQMFKYFSVNRIDNPTRKDIENWRDELIALGRKPATIQLYLTSAKIFFRWLAQENFFQRQGARQAESRTQKRRLNRRAGRSLD